VSDLAAIYTETQEFPFRRGIFLIVLMAFAAIPLFLKLPWWMTGGILIIGCLVAALINSVLILHVRLTTATLEFGFWFSSPEIQLPEIVNPEVVDIPIAAGIGMHYYKGNRVYNARFGRGVKISTSKKQYIIGSGNPEQLRSAILGALPRKSS